MTVTLLPGRVRDGGLTVIIDRIIASQQINYMSVYESFKNIGVLLDELFYCYQLSVIAPKYPSLLFKLQFDAFVASCSTELPAAFI